MQQAHNKEIAGLTFEITEESFVSGRALLVKVSKIVGPAILRLLSGANSLAEVSAGGDLSGAAMEALEQVTDEKLKEIEAILMKSTRVFFESGKRPFLSECRDLAFSGPQRWARYFGWLRFALEVNFSGFFDLLTPPAPVQKADPRE